MDTEEILLDAEERMEKAVSIFHEQLQGLRTGRANPGLVDSIRVNYYGSPTPLKQLAQISVPEPQQIVIRPFDAGVLNDIVKAIQASDAGLAPNPDGRLIRLNIPPLSTERRRELAGRVKKFAEEARAIHYGEKEERDIYGEATLSEVKELVEEEIPVAPVPMPSRKRKAS
mgnify:CR=1 FL=1